MGRPHIFGRNTFIFLPNISEMHRSNRVNGYEKSKRVIVCKVYGTKWNCRMSKKGMKRGRDVKVFYSLLKHALGVLPTHSRLWSFHGEDLKHYVIYSTVLFPPPWEQFWGTLELFDMKSVKKAECLKTDHVLMCRSVVTFNSELRAVIGLQNWIHSPTQCCSLSLGCTWLHPLFLSTTVRYKMLNTYYGPDLFDVSGDRILPFFDS